MTISKSLLATLGMIVLSACVPSREPLSFQGHLLFADGDPAPAGYFLYLEERRAAGLSPKVGLFAIAAIEPKSDGSFSYSGYVCKDLVLIAPLADLVMASHDDPLWSQPIKFVADAKETELIRSSSWPDDISDATRIRQIEEFNSKANEVGDAGDVPCHF